VIAQLGCIELTLTPSPSAVITLISRFCDLHHRFLLDAGDFAARRAECREDRVLVLHFRPLNPSTMKISDSQHLATITNSSRWQKISTDLRRTNSGMTGGFCGFEGLDGFI